MEKISIQLLYHIVCTCNITHSMHTTIWGQMGLPYIVMRSTKFQKALQCLVPYSKGHCEMMLMSNLFLYI